MFEIVILDMLASRANDAQECHNHQFEFHLAGSEKKAGALVHGRRSGEFYWEETKLTVSAEPGR
jgi:hypothetical protein